MINIEELSSCIIDEKLKDSSPMETVTRIKSILKEIGVETEETWFESNVPFCYSNKIKVPGTTFRTIGKGLTKELAIASGYGELMERLQIGFIYGPTSIKDGDYAIDDVRYELIPAGDLLAQHRDWFEAMANFFVNSTGEQITAEQIISQCTTADGMVSVTPYFDLTTLEKVYFPTVLRKRVYGSNGCAAGNTPEEALVQAISEIVERSHQIKAVKEGLCLPVIPDEVLKEYKISYAIIQYVRSQGYKVLIKDASLNTGFPVVCACIIDPKTGRYHTHFGAHPVFEIALERSLTESFQGRNINDIAQNEEFSARNNATFSPNTFYAELRTSSGNKRPGFFVGESTLTFTPPIGVTSCDNKDILRFCKEFFAKKGFPVLVRDCSCLGFPTYQVIVPGYSECYINRILTKTDDQHYAPYAITVLRDPAKASIPDMLGLLMHIDRKKTLDSQFHDIHSFTMLIKTPASTSHHRQNFLLHASLGYVYFTIGRYPEAAKCVANMISNATGDQLGFLICLKRYLSLLSEGYDASYVRQVLTFFHAPDTVEKLLNMLQKKQNPLNEFVLHCDKSCPESCLLYGECFLKRVDAIAAILDEKTQQLNFDEMADHLRKIN